MPIIARLQTWKFAAAAKLAFSAAMAAGLLCDSCGAAQASVAATSSTVPEAAMTSTALIARWQPLIAEAAHRFRIPQSWIRAVMRMESGGRTLSDAKHPITSDKGAMGLMQIMPPTWHDMRAQWRLGDDPYDPHDNVMAGAAYLRFLRDRFGKRMFAAYNAGPGTLQALADGGRLPAETRAYVKGIAVLLGVDSELLGTVNPIITLTRPDGTKVEIAAAAVDSVRAALVGEYAPGVNTVIEMGERHQGVREDLATVQSRLGRGRANI